MTGWCDHSGYEGEKRQQEWTQLNFVVHKTLVNGWFGQNRIHRWIRTPTSIKPMTCASSFLEMMEETNLICYEFQSQHKSFSSNITNHFKLIA